MQELTLSEVKKTLRALERLSDIEYTVGNIQIVLRANGRTALLPVNSGAVLNRAFKNSLNLLGVR